MSNKSPLGAQASAASRLPLPAVDNSHGGGTAAAKGKSLKMVKFALPVPQPAGSWVQELLQAHCGHPHVYGLSLLCICIVEDIGCSKEEERMRREAGETFDGKWGTRARKYLVSDVVSSASPLVTPLKLFTFRHRVIQP